MTREILLAAQTEKTRSTEIQQNDILTTAIKQLRLILKRLATLLVELNNGDLINVMIYVYCYCNITFYLVL